jgi:hypothetical protein
VAPDAAICAQWSWFALAVGLRTQSHSARLTSSKAEFLAPAGRVVRLLAWFAICAAFSLSESWANPD